MRLLDGEREARIMQKFRLDWNYHSNNLEGNSLTYGETKALLLFGITAQGKPLKDHFEITGHNEAINWILDLVKGETELTEHFIRQLHTLLLKEASYKEAVTPDGKTTRRLIEVGKYKSQPNHVVTVTGETFYFATPEETPAKMHDLIEWFRKERKKKKVNPIILAALFHYRFIRIHPFDDGNGRTARILMNFILMQFGYPPVIIKTEDKENYYAVLRLADADELEPFIEYIAQNLIHSLEIMIKGAKGESVEEPDDLNKEILLIEQRLKFTQEDLSIPKNLETIYRVIDFSLKQLIEKFISESSKFSKLYTHSGFRLYSDSTNYHLGEENLDKSIKELIRENTESFSLIFDFIRLKYISLEKLGIHPFGFQSRITVNLNSTNYEVFNEKNNKFRYSYKKLYSESLTEDEINNLVKGEIEEHKSSIDIWVIEYKNLTNNLKKDLKNLNS